MALDRLLGTWALRMDHVAVREPVHGSWQVERVLDGAFLQVRWTYAHPAFPDALVLVDEAHWHTFDVRGVARVFDLQHDDAGWSIVRRDPDFWQRSAARFAGDDALEGTGENSHDGGVTWEHDYLLSCRRTGP